MHLFQRLFLTFAANIKCYKVKRRLFGFFCLLGVVVLLLGAAACEKVNDVLKSLGLSDTEIVAGLKEVLQGGDSAASHYLREKTYTKLEDKFTPVVKESMGKTEVNSYYETLSTNYNEVVGKVNAIPGGMALVKAAVPDLPDRLDTDLSRFITTKGLDGLFYLMKGEEKKIRTNPLDYASDIIRKVFNSPEAHEKKNG